ncbi:MAG: hypothetical protein ACK5EO_08750 [Planctomycetota bacterium]
MTSLTASANKVKLVNLVRSQYRQCRQQGQYRPNPIMSAAGGRLTQAHSMCRRP